jgi:HPt (histidine-containing phosphotransfer) domain-containing protein
MSDEKIIVEVDEDLEDLIPGFLENRSSDVANLKKAADEGDFESLRSIGHSLKGVGGGYGFEKMSQIGAEIEIAAKGQQLDDIKTGVSELENYLQNIDVKFI